MPQIAATMVKRFRQAAQQLGLSHDVHQVVTLARAQERELRSWLFEGRAPGSMPEVASLAAGVRQIQQDVEARHGVPVEVVTVGDCPLDDDLGALLEAAREAVVNAAKWSQASVISLYAEVTAVRWPCRRPSEREPRCR